MIKLDRLKTWLSQTGTQKSNNPLYQILFYLIDSVRELQGVVNTNAEEAASVVTGFENLDFLTHGDESATLPNSRQLVPGAGITFDDSVANQRSISATASSGIWMPLTDGVTPETQLIFDGFGSCIMVFVPQP